MTIKSYWCREREETEKKRIVKFLGRGREIERGEEGREEGREKGREEGREEGIEEGTEKGRGREEYTICAVSLPCESP